MIEKLYIFNEHKAATHIPDRPTLVVRLEGTPEHPCPPLQQSPFYTVVLDYGSVADGDIDESLSPNVCSINQFCVASLGDYQGEERASRLFRSLDWIADTKELFDVGTARRMIYDFEKYYRSVDALVVHCAVGATRSPTYALAMNDLFDLGFDSLRLRTKYRLLSQHMYRTLMDVGSTMMSR